MGYPSYDTWGEQLDEKVRIPCLRDSKAWFPGVHTSDEKFLIHSIMGMAFEAGEAGDVIKKWHRHEVPSLADPKPGQALDVAKLGDEIADTFIYLLHVCSAAGIDLEAEVARKRKINAKRFARPA